MKYKNERGGGGGGVGEDSYGSVHVKWSGEHRYVYIHTYTIFKPLAVTEPERPGFSVCIYLYILVITLFSFRIESNHFSFSSYRYRFPFHFIGFDD